MNPCGATPSVNAVTTFAWDPTWDDVVRITAPLSDTSSTGLRSDGRPAWRYANGVRVDYYYDATCGELATVTYPDATQDVITHDAALCNVATSATPLHAPTTYLRDDIGRVIRTISPVDSAGTITRSDTVGYSVMDQVLRSRAWSGTDSLVATNQYDNEGHLTATTQEAFPHLARSWAYGNPDLGALTRGYSYDGLGRKTYETSGAGGWTSSYDQAGNVLSGKDNGNVARTYTALNQLTTQVGDDNSSFTYDPVMGWMTAADNQNAQVRRGYYPNGAIKVDTLRIATEGVATPDFSSHIYVTSYEYDLNGRRTKVTNHLGHASTYSYDPRTGNLGTVTDVAGNVHRFHYDAMGRLDTLVRLSGRPDSIVDSRTFDAASRTRYRTVTRLGTASPIYADTLGYDGRDKTLSHNGDRMTYAPLGPLTSSSIAGFSAFPEDFHGDALGLLQWRTTMYQDQRSTGHRALATDTLFYTPGSLSLAASVKVRDVGTPDTTTHDFDGLGNESGWTTTSHFDPPIDTPPTDPGTGHRNTWGGFTQTINHYSRENRLTSSRLEKDTIFVDGGRSVPYYATETYKYDALGRRVWVRSIKPTSCRTNDPTSGCHSTDTRTIWDGAQLLSEERSQPADDASAGYYNFGTQYGTVEYTHVGVIDEPMTMVTPIAVILPYADWRGVMDKGSNASTTSGAIGFPGGQASAYRSNLSQTNGDPNWLGALATQQTDASGYQYKRNRYYDPTSGRFTQEDPIGLAGGFNTYGYAGGDPVTYSDPFGLCPIPASDCPAGYWTAMGTAVGALVGGVGGGTGGFFGGAGVGAIPGALAGASQGAALGGAAGALVDGVVFATKQGRAVGRAESLAGHIEDHLGKLAEEPNGPASNRWRVEIRAGIDNVSRQLKDMKGQALEKWEKTVQDWTQRLKDLNPQ